MKVLPFLILIFAIASCKYSATKDSHYEKANEYFFSEDYINAEKEYKLAIKNAPKDKRAYLTLANVYCISGEFQSALTCLDKLIELYPNYSTGYTSRAAVYSYLENDAGALSDMKSAVRCNKNNVLAIISVAHYYYASHQYEAAIPYYDKAIALTNDDGALYAFRGSCRYNMGAFTSALMDLDVAIEKNPGYYPNYLSRGCVYAEKENYEKALVDFNTYISLDSNSGNGYLYRGYYYNYKQGFKKEACSDFRLAQNKSPETAQQYIDAYCK